MTSAGGGRVREPPAAERVQGSLRLRFVLVVPILLAGLAACGPRDLVPEVRDRHGMTPLMRAAAEGNASEVRRLVDGGAGVEKRVRARPIRELLAFLGFFQELPPREPGFTALHFAVAGGHVDAAAALLEAGPPLGAEDDPPGLHPLYLAIRRGPAAAPLVGLLLEHGSPVTPPPGRTGRTPLHLAAGGADVEVVRLLLDSGAPLDARDREEETPLIRAARVGRANVVGLLLDAGADPELRGGRQGWTALTWAEAGGQEAVARLLRTRGASLATESNRALAEAVSRGDPEGVRAALDAGADPAARSRTGGDLVLAAIRRGSPEVVRILLEEGASMPRDPLGRTALEIAVSEGRLDVADILLGFDADPSAPGLVTAAAGAGSLSLLVRFLEAGSSPSEGGGAPLRAAARAGSPEVVRHLLALGVDPDADDEYGRSPLDLGAARGDPEVVRLLLEGGAQVEGGQDGWSPLMDATLAGSAPLVRLLLEHGADPTRRASDERSVPELAAASGSAEVERLVREALR